MIQILQIKTSIIRQDFSVSHIVSEYLLTLLGLHALCPVFAGGGVRDGGCRRGCVGGVSQKLTHGNQ